MRARDLAGLALALVLGTAVAAKAARVASLHGGTRVELGRFKLTAIEEATRERLATLTDPVVLTYYVSARESMPSELRRLERDVTELLDALARASDGKLSFQVIDPDADEERRRFATRAGIAPFRRRTILRDAWSERTVWSSLAIAYGAYPPAAINGLTPEHLPRLQGLLVARLDQMERPRRPAVALAAPEGFAELEAELARRADVQRVDLAAGGELPRATDVLVWADPGPVGAAALRRVDDYLASGRSVVLAGGLARLEAPAPPPSGETRGADAGRPTSGGHRRREAREGRTVGPVRDDLGQLGLAARPVARAGMGRPEAGSDAVPRRTLPHGQPDPLPIRGPACARAPGRALSRPKREASCRGRPRSRGPRSGAAS